VRYIEDENATLFAWLDNSLLLLGGFILMTAMLLMLASAKPVNPKEQQTSSEGVCGEIRWKDGSNSDVDLWFQPPGDVAIGYSRKQGKYGNLLRDDLGSPDPALGNLRFEMACTRGIQPGEFVFNVGLYRLGTGETPPITVDFRATLKTAGGVFEVSHTAIALSRVSEEVTAVRFTLDGNQHLISGSVNHLFKPLWIGG
jgi:hypothetical protein